MKSTKQILSLLFKAALGLGCLLLLYWRLWNDFGPEQLVLLKSSALSSEAFVHFLLCVLLIPVNWGLEARKWQLITAPVESISLNTAMRSVYSGVCLGNFAPGRATEFVGKILYFSDANKSRITLLHFISGMIQLGITLIAGILALLFSIQIIPQESTALMCALFIFGVVLLGLFVFAVLKINTLMSWVSRMMAKKRNLEAHVYKFPSSLWIQLILFSVLRYMVFVLQFVFLLKLFAPSTTLQAMLPGMAMYFMITSLVPMISVLEAAIRTAIALLVLGNSGIAPSALALASLLLWLLNIVIPSAIGYFSLLRMQFDFKLFYRKKT